MWKFLGYLLDIATLLNLKYKKRKFFERSEKFEAIFFSSLFNSIHISKTICLWRQTNKTPKNNFLNSKNSSLPFVSHSAFKPFWLAPIHCPLRPCYFLLVWNLSMQFYSWCLKSKSLTQKTVQLSLAKLFFFLYFNPALCSSAISTSMLVKHLKSLRTFWEKLYISLLQFRFCWI